MPSCEVCAFLFVPPEGVFLFMSRGYLNSGIPLLEKTQMELYNCTLVYDIDAIVLHTNSNTMGQNHVLHIVISVSPFFCEKKVFVCIIFFAVSRITCIRQIKLVCNWFSSSSILCLPFSHKICKVVLLFVCFC